MLKENISNDLKEKETINNIEIMPRVRGMQRTEIGPLLEAMFKAIEDLERRMEIVEQK